MEIIFVRHAETKNNVDGTIQGPEHGNINEKGEKEWFKGTADAVRKNLDHLLKSPADLFLILSGDQLYNINFQAMVEFAQKCKADLTIASIPVMGKEATRMGILKVDPAGKVVQFVEKPPGPDCGDGGIDEQSVPHPQTAAMSAQSAHVVIIINQTD